MASSSGNSSGTTKLLRNSSSEEDLHQPVHQAATGHLVDERKRKRMESNRESARRSRMRKQKLMDDLAVQVADLRAKNTQILNTIGVATQQFLNVEAENSVLRAQVAELSHRLDSLNEILAYVGSSPSVGSVGLAPSLGCCVSQMPIMASDYHDFSYRLV